MSIRDFRIIKPVSPQGLKEVRYVIILVENPTRNDNWSAFGLKSGKRNMPCPLASVLESLSLSGLSFDSKTQSMPMVHLGDSLHPNAKLATDTANRVIFRMNKCNSGANMPLHIRKHSVLTQMPRYQLIVRV